jgi:hypothetical protein
MALLRCVLLAAAVAAVGGGGHAQTPAPDDIRAASAREHQREMDVLHIPALVHGASARNLSAPDVANFDEAKANPYPDLPPVLRTEAGRPVTTPAMWWRVRRPEIQALFDREIYGRVPNNAPHITWRVAETVRETVGGVPAITRKMVGHADNSADPAISVDILMNLTTPAARQGHGVPVIVCFGAVHPRPFPAGFHLVEPDGPDYQELLLKRGWGYAILDTASIQADNGAGLTQGVIGLANGGQPRRMDDWGVLRAWAWGASRAVDALRTDFDVDAKRIGIFGHSRNGKAALVAMAYDPRIAIGYISSSGAGGAALLRRHYGEQIGNLAGDEFYWFAGNFLKYAAVGHTPNELPVDAHELIAMVAPRPLFISAGILMTSPPDAVPGDAWVDPQGMFKAAVAATPVWTLLGREGLQTDQFPSPDTDLDQGEIGFRQHRYGHTPKPNWPDFIRFAGNHLGG